MKNPFYNLIEKNQFERDRLFRENKIRNEIRFKMVKKVKQQLNRKKASLIHPSYVRGHSGDAMDNFIVQCLMLSKLTTLYSPPFNNLHSFEPTERETGLEEWVNANIPDPKVLYPFLDIEDFGYHQQVLYLFNEFGYGPNIEWYRTSPPSNIANTPVNLYFVKIDLSSIDESKKSIFKVGITKYSIKERFRGYLKYIRPLKFIEYSDGRDAWLREQKVVNYDRHRCFRDNLYLKKVEIKEMSDKSTEIKESGNAKLLKGVKSHLGKSEWVCEGFTENNAINLFNQLCDYPPYFNSNSTPKP